MDCNFSKLGTLKLNDFWKGFLLTILTAVLTVVYQSASAGSLVFDHQAVATTAVTAGAAYLLKNIGTGEGGRVGTNAPPSPPPAK